ncbi:hypothetical protein [Kitasatospora sp. NBC_01539]|uniref:hypothetical protein n=1 Tax=Kitasatospora sp. NBC_01539 TaxID=2903577 RepID=UPI0038600B04
MTLTGLRLSKTSGCKLCSAGKHLRVSDQDAEQEMIEAGFIPLEPYPGANESWRCRCTTCNQEVTPGLSRIRVGGGCSVCSAANRPRIPDKQAFTEMMSAGFKPLDPYPGQTGIPWKSRCLTCGRTRKPTLSAARGAKQRLCSHRDGSGKLPVPESEALAQMKAAGWEPLAPYQSTNSPWSSRCMRCGKVGNPALANIRSGSKRRSGCWSCAHQDMARDRLHDEAVAVEIMTLAGVTPTAPYPGMNKPWPGICQKCNRSVSPHFGNIYKGQAGGCRYCATKGIDYAAPSLVYLAVHYWHLSYKIGICNSDNEARRLGAHRKEGWRIVRTLEVQDGWTARLIEKSSLAKVRADGYPRHLTPQQMPQGGYTETLSADAYSESRLWSRICEEAALYSPTIPAQPQESE